MCMLDKKIRSIEWRKEQRRRAENMEETDPRIKRNEPVRMMVDE